MKEWLSLRLLTLALLPGVAQAQRSSHLEREGVIGIARFTESFTSDCCGPSRGATGVSFSLRLKQRISPLTELGVEGGATFAGHRDMEWLMATVSISSSKGVAPWGQLGAGLIAQPGQCPLDGSDTSPDCNTDLNLGASVGGGVRWTIANHFAIGPEVSLVTGLARRERRFTTMRVGFALRLQ